MSDRFSWLEQEEEAGRASQLHLFHADQSEDSDTLEQLLPVIPPSYREFLQTFGGAWLYRIRDWYEIRIYATPHIVVDQEGVELLAIGCEGDYEVYLLRADLMPGAEVPVFDYFEGYRNQLANSFIDWLRRASETARRQYSDDAWAEVMAGPPPFTPDELEIIYRRRAFTWRFLGIGRNRRLTFQITNNSDGLLPFLTIGIRTRDDRLVGAVWLPVASLTPGATARIERECYAELASPEELEPFQLPDPTPTTRYRYWEFRDFFEPGQDGGQSDHEQNGVDHPHESEEN
jgi:hypothetical protein